MRTRLLSYQSMAHVHVCSCHWYFRRQKIIFNASTLMSGLSTAFQTFSKALLSGTCHPRRRLHSQISLIPFFVVQAHDTQLHSRHIQSSRIQNSMSNLPVNDCNEDVAYTFGPWPIHSSEVFATSSLCYAFVNLKPIVPGHVLVSTKRVVPRFTDLTAEETQDLWILAQKVGKMLERHHQASSLTLTIQDGPDAGQTVPHVHVHVLPRKSGDFVPNDQVYDEIDSASKEYGTVRKQQNLDEARQERSPEEMAEEARVYKESLSLHDS